MRLTLRLPLGQHLRGSDKDPSDVGIALAGGKGRGGVSLKGGGAVAYLEAFKWDPSGLNNTLPAFPYSFPLHSLFPITVRSQSCQGTFRPTHATSATPRAFFPMHLGSSSLPNIDPKASINN